MPIFGPRQGYSRGGRRFNPRMLIGLVIVGIGIISYFAKTQINPVTGEKQRVAMSAEQEMTLGLQAAPEMAKQMGGVIDPRRDPRAATVARIGRQLVESSPDVQKSPYIQNFNFHLLADSQMVNAFALPGGQIFITAALFDRLQNEAQLAGVLGHEIGHVIHRHGAEHMATGQLGQMIVTGVAVGASGEDSGRMATMAAAMANQMLQMKYSRGDELESDGQGLKVMMQAGYDPSEMAHVMKVLKAASGRSGGGSAIFASHPDPDARIEKIEAFIREHFGAGIPPNLSKGAPLRGNLDLER